MGDSLRIQVRPELRQPAMVLAFDGWLGGGVNEYDRGDGIILLLLFTVFIYYTINDVIAQRRERVPEEDEPELGSSYGVPVALALTAIGLGGLIYGAQLTVDGATGLARGLGVSEDIIGLTLLAIGTSLPELAASIASLKKGTPDLAIGNAIGSNLFNSLAVVGLPALFINFDINPSAFSRDMPVVIALTLMLLLMSRFPGSGPHRLTRAKGILLFSCFVIYQFMPVQDF